MSPAHGTPNPNRHGGLVAVAMHAFRLDAGKTVGRYELVAYLSRGARGMVYEAIDTSLGRRVAVKVLYPWAPDGEHAGRAAERFLREGRVAARVHHAHVVHVYDVGIDEGLPFLVMELVDGESLAEHLRREGKLTLRRAVELFLPILSGAAELHAAGVVHRDIKPANILLARGARPLPKLADFGISRLEDDGTPTITDTGATLGTPEYMAPELI